MSDKFNNNNWMTNTRPMDYDKEMQLLNNMESVHSRKKAAFDELLRYTFNNVKEPSSNNSDNHNQ